MPLTKSDDLYPGRLLGCDHSRIGIAAVAQPRGRIAAIGQAMPSANKAGGMNREGPI